MRLFKYLIVVTLVFVLPFYGYSVQTDSVLCAVNKRSNLKPYWGKIKIELNSGRVLKGNYRIVNDSTIKISDTLINTGDIKWIKPKRELPKVLFLTGAGLSFISALLGNPEFFWTWIFFAGYFLLFFVLSSSGGKKHAGKYKFGIFPADKAMRRPVLWSLEGLLFMLSSVLVSIVFDGARDGSLEQTVAISIVLFLFLLSYSKLFQAVYVSFKYKYNTFQKIMTVLLALVPVALIVAAVLVLMAFASTVIVINI